MDISFNELRCKEVINILDGRRLGRICDMVINCKNCRVVGIVVPGERRIFHGRNELFISWPFIKKIGDDVILVAVNVTEGCQGHPSGGKHGRFNYGGGGEGERRFDGDYVIDDDR